MKNICLLLAGLGFASWVAAAENPSLPLIADGPIKLTLKALPSDKGDWGIDWEADFKKNLTEDIPENDARSISLGFTSRGFVVLDKTENASDSITASLKLEGGAWVPVRPAAPAPRPIPDDDTPIPDDFLKGASWYIFPSFNVVTETNQAFDKFNTGVGASLAVTTSQFNRVLDLIPSLLRYGPNAAHNNPRHVDISVGYKYLDQKFVSTLFPQQENISRGDLNVEWETGILSTQRLVVRYNGYYLFSQATEKYVDFVVVRIDLLRLPASLNGGAVSIKYTSGQLPPTYQKGTSLGAGLSLEF